MLSTSLLYPASARAKLIKSFVNLPDFLRPTHVGIDESGPFTLIESETGLQSYAEKRKTGFFLRGENTLYDLIISGDKPIRANCFFSASVPVSINFMIHMANAGPIFAFCCNEEERKRKNRLVTRLDANAIESWVGRDPFKYIPGLYWITLISTTLLTEHNISITAIAAIAEDHIIIGGTHHLFRFYKTPDDWLSPKGEMVLHTPFPAIFDIEKVRAQTAGVSNFLELTKILHIWM